MRVLTDSRTPFRSDYGGLFSFRNFISFPLAFGCISRARDARAYGFLHFDSSDRSTLCFRSSPFVRSNKKHFLHAAPDPFCTTTRIYVFIIFPIHARCIMHVPFFVLSYLFCCVYLCRLFIAVFRRYLLEALRFASYLRVFWFLRGHLL